MEQLGIAFAAKLFAFLGWLSNPVTQLLAWPLLGCIFISMTPKGNLRLIRFWAVLFSGLSLLSALLMISGLPEGMRQTQFFAQYLPFRAGAGMQFTQEHTWLSIVFGETQSFSVNYSVGVDGLSLPLIVMGAALIFLCVIWALHRSERVRDYFALVLLLEVGLLGVFVAMDYVLFYLFWELMLIPMFFLISGWGKNRERAGKAAIKFFVYTMFGSVFMLIAFISMQVLSAAGGAGLYSFSIQQITISSLTAGISNLPHSWRMLMFIGLLLGFAVKVPMFPFHTWLPDAHTEAPAEISAILAGVMLKTGAYAFLRILYPTFPDVAYTLGPIISLCAVIAIVYGAAITLVQTDLKRMVAYSSISHMGFIVLGISAQNMDATIGAVYHMVGHGIIITTLFLLTGVIERRYGTLEIRELAGMLKASPAYAGVLAVAAFASMGVPLLVGFWGEFLVLKGTFYNSPVWQSVHIGTMDGSRFLQILAIVPVVGILTTAVYMINMLQRVLPGEPPAGQRSVRWFRLNEGLVLVPLTIAMFALFIFPGPIIGACKDYAAHLWMTALQF